MTQDEQVLKIAREVWHGLWITWANPVDKQSVPVPVNEQELLEFARRLRAEWSAGQEPAADPDGSDCLRISKSGYSLRVGWGDDKRIVAVAPGTPEQHYRADQQVTEQWLADAERLCDGWNRAAPVAKPAAQGMVLTDSMLQAALEASQWFDPTMSSRENDAYRITAMRLAMLAAHKEPQK